MVHVMRYGARDAGLDRAELRGYARLAGIADDQIVEERFLAVHVVTHVLPSPEHGLAGRPGVAVPGRRGCTWLATGSGRRGGSRTRRWPAAGRPACWPPGRRRRNPRTRGWREPDGDTGRPRHLRGRAPAPDRPRLPDHGLARRRRGRGAGGVDTVGRPRTPRAVDNPAGWLTTVTSRLALDRLRAQRRRREVYVGPWLPDPVPTARSAEETAELGESLTLGFLVLLDSLGPSGAGRVPPRGRVRRALPGHRRDPRKERAGVPAARLARQAEAALGAARTAGFALRRPASAETARAAHGLRARGRRREES